MRDRAMFWWYSVGAVLCLVWVIAALTSACTALYDDVGKHAIERLECSMNERLSECFCISEVFSTTYLTWAPLSACDHETEPDNDETSDTDDDCCDGELSTKPRMRWPHG